MDTNGAKKTENICYISKDSGHIVKHYHER